MALNRKHIYILDVLIISISLIGVLGIIGYARPLVIAPIDGFVTPNTSVLFMFEKAGVILLDDNLEFSSPERIYAENNLVITLEPGNYYWMVEGALKSEVRQLSVRDMVALQLKEAENGKKYELVNVGNTLLNVEVYENGSLASEMLLGVGRKSDVSGEKFIGREEDDKS